MNKILKVGISLCAIVGLLIVGVYIGLQLNVEGVDNTVVNPKIAIVNLDLGVDYNGENRNFGKELLPESEKDYIVTGLTDAKEGIKDGSYTAYIIMPASLSENVASINTTQTPITFTYEASEKVSSIARDKTIVSIYEFENKFNKNLSSMYITSILKNYHNGQDGATEVLSNDEKDAKLISEIQSSDLTEIVNIRETQPLENTISDLDIANEENKNESVINEIDESYKGFMILSQEELNGIKSDYGTVDSDFVALQLMIDNIPKLINEDDTKGYSLANHDLYIDSMNNEASRKISEHNSVLDSFRTKYDALSTSFSAFNTSSKISNLNTEYTIQAPLLAYLKANPGKTLTDAAGYYSTNSTMNSQVNAYMRNNGLWFDEENNPTVNDYVNTLSYGAVTSHTKTYNDASNKVLEVSNGFATDLGVLPSALTTVEDGSIDPTSVTDDMIVLPSKSILGTELAKDLSILDLNQKTAISSLMSEYINQKDGMNELKSKVDSYDPISNIDNSVIDKLVSDFKNNNRVIEKKVSDKNSEYTDYVNSVEKKTNEHIQQLREDLEKANTDSNTKVEQGLSSLKQEKQKTSEENKKVMSEFINTLKYTRNGSLLNTDAVNFIAKPIETYGDLKVSESWAEGNMPLIMLISGITLTLVGCLFITRDLYKKRKKS